jgi:hypothetical protein
MQADKLVTTTNVVDEAIQLISDGDVQGAADGLARLRAHLLTWVDKAGGATPAQMDDVAALEDPAGLATSEGFAEALAVLVGEAEDAGLSPAAMAAELRLQADAIEDTLDEEREPEAG